MTEGVRLDVAVSEEDAVFEDVEEEDAVAGGVPEGLARFMLASTGGSITDRHLVLAVGFNAMGALVPAPVTVSKRQSWPSAMAAVPRSDRAYSTKLSSERPTREYTTPVVLKRVQGCMRHAADAASKPKARRWQEATAPASAIQRELPLGSNTTAPRVAVRAVCTDAASKPGSSDVIWPAVVGRPEPTVCGPRLPASPNTATSCSPQKVA